MAASLRRPHRFVAVLVLVSLLLSSLPPGALAGPTAPRISPVHEPIATPSSYDALHDGSPSTPWTSFAGGVNVVLGNYTLQASDISLPAPGVPLAFARTYNSAGRVDGPLGYGWTHSYDVSILADSDSSLLLRSGDGRLDRYERQADGSYLPPPGVYSVLLAGQDGMYALTTKDRTIYLFDPNGRLREIVDRDRNVVHLAYERDELRTVSVTGGMTLTFEYDASHQLTAIQDPAGRRTEFGYDSAGLLATVANPSGALTRYEYDAERKLSRVIDANDHAPVENRYDSQARVVEQADALGRRIRFDYDWTAGETRVEDRRGYVTVYYYDKLRRTRGLQDALGSTECYDYDDQNNRISVTDRRGSRTDYGFDPFGNPVQVTDALGHISAYAYDSASNPVVIRDPLQRETTLSYDPNGHLLSIMDPMSRSTYLAYAPGGQVACIADATGHAKAVEYDAKGNPLAVAGDVWSDVSKAVEHTVDVVPRWWEDARRWGPTFWNGVAGQAEQARQAAWDALSSVPGQAQQFGGGMVFSASEATAGGRAAVATVVASGSGEASRRLSGWNYFLEAGRIAASQQLDQAGRGLAGEGERVSSAAGGAWQDAQQRLEGWNSLLEAARIEGEHVISPLESGRQAASGALAGASQEAGNRLSGWNPVIGYAGDLASGAANAVSQGAGSAANLVSQGAGQVGSSVSGAFNSGSAGTAAFAASTVELLGLNPGALTKLAYDALGRLIAVQKSDGQAYVIEYDAAGRISRVIDPLGGKRTFEYDAVGNLLTATASDGAVTRQHFDELNRLIATLDATGAETRYAYDENGNLTAVTDARGNISRAEYDALNRRVTVRDPLGNEQRAEYDPNGNIIVRTDEMGMTTRYEYDGLDRVVTMIDSLGHVTRRAYDSAGNLVSTVDPNGRVTGFEYDAANRLVRVIDAANGVTSAEYDAAGRMVAVTNPNGKTTRYGYDDQARLSQVTDALGNATRYTYDRAGNQVEAWDAEGRKSWFEYDRLNRLVKANYPVDVNLPFGRKAPSPFPETVQYEYDSEGRRLAMHDTTGATRYRYDPVGRLAAITNPEGLTVGYEYDADGNRTGLTYPDGRRVAYEYDAANRLRTLREGDLTTSYGYDGSGELVQMGYPNGMVTRYGYDAVHRLLSVAHSGATGTLCDLSYELDAAGNRIAEMGGATHISYELDALYRLVRSGPGEAGDTRYGYDAAGNRTTTWGPAGSASYGYDDADRLTTLNGRACGLDRNGNLLSDGVRQFEYDTHNRLTKVISGTTTVEYRYNGDDHLVEQKVNGHPTRFVLDPTGLPTILEARDGNQVTAYLHGLGPIGEEGPGGRRLYYGRDGLGSVRFTSDATGTLVRQLDYGPFGEPRGEPGDRPLFGYTGEPSSPADGLIFLRARHYDPVLGRFLTRDTVSGALDAPQTLNLYTYVGNNPANGTDPTGHFAPVLVAAAMAGAMGGGVSGISYSLTHPSANLLTDGGFYQAIGMGIVGGAAGAAAGFAAAVGVAALVPGSTFVGCILAAAGSGGASSSATQVMGNLLTGRDLTADLGGAAASGTVTGGVFGGAGYMLRQLPGEVLGWIARIADTTVKDGPTAAQTGTAKHAAAGRIVRWLQPFTRLAGKEWHSEVSYDELGNPVTYGTSGSTRLDVVVGDPLDPDKVFDFKFGKSGMTQAWIDKVRGMFGNPNLPVIQLP